MVTQEEYGKKIRDTAYFYFVFFQILFCGGILFLIISLTKNDWLAWGITIPIAILVYILKPALVMRWSGDPPRSS
jgi:ABC-type transport system involved in multi-copper enzyme maturation permease subunit